MRRPRFADDLACKTLAGLVDSFDAAFKTPLCARIEECLQAIDDGNGGKAPFCICECDSEQCTV